MRAIALMSGSGCRKYSRDSFCDNGEIRARRRQDARSQLSTGAGEIGRMKITPTFETRGDGPAKLMSENPAAQMEGES